MIPSDEFSGVETVPVPDDTALVFTFEHNTKKPKLYIRSGANLIKWSYNLNTVTTPTLGGEVTQILSANVGPMTIEGVTAGYQTGETINRSKIPGYDQIANRFTPIDELMDIYQWFLDYMRIAGAGPRRDESAMRFTYPARGWDFYIQPRLLNGFKFDKTQYAMPWQIVAEVMSENALDYMRTTAMSKISDTITNRSLLQQIEYSINQRDRTSLGYYGNSPFVNPTLGTSLSEIATTMGSNFQRLVAAWTSADGISAMFTELGGINALPKDVDAAYEKAFGSSYIVTGTGVGNGTGTGSGSGSYTYTGPPNATGAVQVAGYLASEVAALTGSARVGVAAVSYSMEETGLDASKRGPVKDGARDYLGPNGYNQAVGLSQTHYLPGGDPMIYKASVTTANPDLAGKSDPKLLEILPLDKQVGQLARFFQSAMKDSRLSGYDWVKPTDAQLAELIARVGLGPNYDTTFAQSYADHKPVWINNLKKAAEYIAQSTKPVGDTASDGFVFYLQSDSRWSNYPFGSSTIGPSGCGITSLAMIVATLKDKTVTPITVSDWVSPRGGYIPGTGSSWQVVFIDAPAHFGLKSRPISTDYATAIKTIQGGGYVIASGTGSAPFSSGGHISVLRGVKDGSFLMANTSSNLGPNRGQLYSPDTLRSAGLKAMWAVTL